MESSASPEPPRRRPGRPKGSKNRQTLINERKAARLEADSLSIYNKQLENTLRVKDVKIKKKRAKIS